MMLARFPLGAVVSVVGIAESDDLPSTNTRSFEEFVLGIRVSPSFECPAILKPNLRRHAWRHLDLLSHQLALRHEGVGAARGALNQGPAEAVPSLLV